MPIIRFKRGFGSLNRGEEAFYDADLAASLVANGTGEIVAPNVADSDAARAALLDAVDAALVDIRTDLDAAAPKTRPRTRTVRK